MSKGVEVRDNLLSLLLLGSDGILPEDVEKFTLKLDKKSEFHTKACSLYIHEYADVVERKYPKLAKELKERYPLSSQEYLNYLIIKQRKDNVGKSN
jgi:hypothetical protein